MSTHHPFTCFCKPTLMPMPAPSGRAMAAACTQTECLLTLKWHGDKFVDRITVSCGRFDTHTGTVARKVFQSRKAVCTGFRRGAHHRQCLPHNALPRTKATTQCCRTMAELSLTDQLAASYQACSETRWYMFDTSNLQSHNEQRPIHLVVPNPCSMCQPQVPAVSTDSFHLFSKHQRPCLAMSAAVPTRSSISLISRGTSLDRMTGP